MTPPIPSRDRAHWLHCLGLWILLATIPWAFRMLSLWEWQLRVGTADLRGILADGTGAAVVAWLTLAMRRRIGRWPALLPSLGWAALVVAAHEQVRSLSSPLSLDYVRYLFDPVFLMGSALRPRLLMQLALSMTLVGAGSWWLLRRRPTVRDLVSLGLIVLVSGGGLLATPVRQDTQSWRQTLLRQTLLLSTQSAEPGPEKGLRQYRQPDLHGARWLGPLEGSPDVLLVVLEGVSGGSLPSVTSAHGRTLDFAMPKLDELARSAVTASSFVAEQRQTNRGLYTLLCGQSPKLLGGEARLTAIARGLPHPPCLPELLREAGYRTAFFEATPLPFMFMDAAMPRLGFESIADDAEFKQAAVRNTWGVDDRTFLTGAVDLVNRLDEQPSPWFLTLLTAGTHHPYDAVPDDFSSPYDPRTLAHAMAFLDQAIGEFLQSLDLRSRDLVLLVASDESAGLIDGKSDLDRELSQNWGLLIVRTPDRDARRIDQPVLQSDVALSLLDLLGWEPRPSGSGGPGGRSLFRNADGERLVEFGNTYQGRISSYDAGTGDLLRCGESFRECAQFHSTAGTLFGGAWLQEEVSAGMLAALREGVLATEGSPSESGAVRSYDLAVPGSRPIQTDGHQMVFGGQYLDVPADSRVTIDLAAEVTGGSGWAHIRHALSSDGKGHYRSQFPVLAPGDSFELRYSFRTGDRLDRLDARMLVDSLEGTGLGLRLDRAHLEILPEAGGTTEIETLRASVRRASPPPTFRYSLESRAPKISSGLSWSDGSLVWNDIAPVGGLIPGPRFYAATGSLLRVRATVVSETGRIGVRLLLGSEEPSLVLASGESWTLLPGEVVELQLEHRLTATLNEVVSGLVVDATGQGTTTLALRDLKVEVMAP